VEVVVIRAPTSQPGLRVVGQDQERVNIEKHVHKHAKKQLSDSSGELIVALQRSSSNSNEIS
jgi:hypothetical protein